MVVHFGFALKDLSGFGGRYALVLKNGIYEGTGGSGGGWHNGSYTFGTGGGFAYKNGIVTGGYGQS
jgi:hypothetical protein